MVEFVENMVQIEIPRQIVSLLRTACNFQRQMVFSVLTWFTKVLNRQATTSKATNQSDRSLSCYNVHTFKLSDKRVQYSPRILKMQINREFLKRGKTACSWINLDWTSELMDCRGSIFLSRIDPQQQQHQQQATVIDCHKFIFLLQIDPQ